MVLENLLGLQTEKSYFKTFVFWNDLVLRLKKRQWQNRSLAVACIFFKCPMLHVVCLLNLTGGYPKIKKKEKSSTNLNR